MIGFFRKWLNGVDAEPKQEPRQVTSAIRAKPKPPSQPQPRPAAAPANGGDAKTTGQIVDAGPGKNVLIRQKYFREDSGTHETLKILDDSLIETGEETGIDPYNTGKFDRSKNWDKRFR